MKVYWFCVTSSPTSIRGTEKATMLGRISFMGMILNDFEVRHSSLSNTLRAPHATLPSLVSDIERSSETVRRMRGPESFICKTALLVSKQHAIKALQISPRKRNTTVASGLCSLDFIRGGKIFLISSHMGQDKVMDLCEYR